MLRTARLFALAWAVVAFGRSSAAAANGRLLVHGLAADEGAVARARDAIAGTGRPIPASVVMHTGRRLPYRDYLVDRLVVTGREIDQDEALRDDDSWPFLIAGDAVYTVGERVHGLALAADAVVVCGAAEVTGPGPRGFVRLLARDTGTTIIDRPLDGLPGWDPMALAGGRIYVSSDDGRMFCLGER